MPTGKPKISGRNFRIQPVAAEIPERFHTASPNSGPMPLTTGKVDQNSLWHPE